MGSDRLRTPTATYRLQLNHEFTFRDACAMVPYLAGLGISHLYLSPISQAVKGSMHGYDVADASHINEELGGEEGFNELAAEAARHGLSILLDIVPNHMAASPENPWWMDVLENGIASMYSAYFDVEWGRGAPTGQQKIYLPILGQPYSDALEQQQLRLSIGEAGIRVNYFERPLPLDPASYIDVLHFRLPELLARLDPNGEALHEFGMLLEIAERLPGRTLTDWETLETRRRDVEVIKKRLWDVYTERREIREHLDENIRLLNGQAGDPSSFDALDALLRKQAFELAYWRVAREKINYRRFFDVTGLIAIRVQDPAVFDAVHELPLRLAAEGKIGGLRVDHVDGLYDPASYLARLQQRATEAAGDTFYIAVEKILAFGEELPNDWPIAGTTGYDFIGQVNNVFVYPEGLGRLSDYYVRFSGLTQSAYDVANEQKRKIMRDLFVGEMGVLAFYLSQLAEQDRYARDLSPLELRRGLTEVTISLAVYRTYVREPQVGAHDREYLDRAVADARRRNPSITPSVFDFIERTLLLTAASKDDALEFLMRWQQLTSPIMAKGVEDTTLYVYNRLLSMNEVGGNPEPLSVAEFHRFNSARNSKWPGAMSATSTHDTKRSEDVRARLNVLSEMPDEWCKHVQRWTRWNTAKRRNVKGTAAPAPNGEYFLYQTLMGAWPIEKHRLSEYLIKAAREAKVYTSWLEPNEAYEEALLSFASQILDPQTTGRVLPDFERVHARVAFYGAVNALAQTLLKITAPGIPDFYQSTETWNLRLVDPDNRVPPSPGAPPPPASFDPALLSSWQDGRIKTFLIGRALTFRKENTAMYESGEYVPLDAGGTHAEHALAFARRQGAAMALTIVPRFSSRLSALERFPIGRRIWRDTYVAAPDDAPDEWRDIFTNARVRAADHEGSKVLYVSDALERLPFALLAPLPE